MTLTTGPRAIVPRANGLCTIPEEHHGIFSPLRTAFRKNVSSHMCLQDGMLARCWTQQHPGFQVVLTTMCQRHAGEWIGSILIRPWYIE